MSTAIKVEHLSKQYRLGEVGTGTISSDLKRWWHKVRGLEDPFLKIGETNDRTTKGDSEYVWALQDVNFEIEQGDVVGIIGRNGAGKSTLLKILSKTTLPTIGTIKSRGRIASLLEVGTGFNPELSGRDNIFLNGAILGMTKREIKAKFDEIVDFAGVERYIDTPVKRYSSGMYVRLAFAVAAHLEPEILIVDEVLAVGDAEFQKKAIGKMQDVSTNGGRTVLFVSHNMAAVKSLCKSGIYMKNGGVELMGGIQDVIDRYLLSGSDTVTNYYKSNVTTEGEILEVKILGKDGELRDSFNFDEDIFINVKVSAIFDLNGNEVLTMIISDKDERRVFTTQKIIAELRLNTKDCIFEATIKIPKDTLVPNMYKIWLASHIPNVKFLSLKENIVEFNIEETGTIFHLYQNIDYGCVFVNCDWV